jgi:hypothetical protein
MRAERVKNRKYVRNLNRQRAGSFAVSIMVEICKGAVLWSRIRSILVARDLDLTQHTKVLEIKEMLQVICRVLPINQDIAYSFCFTGAETEIHKIKDDSKIIRQTNLDRRGLRPIPIICHLLDPPPSFSLPTTFKKRGCYPRIF